MNYVNYINIYETNNQDDETYKESTAVNQWWCYVNKSNVCGNNYAAVIYNTLHWGITCTYEHFTRTTELLGYIQLLASTIHINIC